MISRRHQICRDDPRVAEGFGATGAGSGKRSGKVSAGETSSQVGSAHVLMQKSGVGFVAGSFACRP